MKYKNPGMSLAIAFVSSMLVLFLALYTFSSITRSFERTIGIERGNKVFFAAESGIEAAFFHKNSRERSSHFDWTTWEDASSNSCDTDTPSAECQGYLKTITINLDDTATETKWRLISRFIPEDSDGSGTFSTEEKTYNGSIKQFQTVEIPLYYDSSMLPTDDPSISTNQGEIDPTIIVQFPAEVPRPGGSNFNFGNTLPIDDVSDDASFDASVNKRQRILVDWSISRLHSSNGIQNFVPRTNFSRPCLKEILPSTDPKTYEDSDVICELELQDGQTQVEFTINSASITGDYLPCPTGPGNCPTDLNTFLTEANTSNFKVRFESLLPYEHTLDGSKFNNIPFQMVLNGNTDELPQSQYTIVATVTRGDYEKEVSFTVDEARSIGAFNYVLFD